MAMNTHSRQPNCGFTMIELLVVIGIIAVLISIVIPSLSFAKKSSYNAACLGNLRQIMIANNVYVIQNNNKIPYSGRGYPYMGMMDEWELCIFQNTSTNVKYAHCPAERFAPSYWAAWWQGSYGRAMAASDHLPQVQSLITNGTLQAVAPYSYLWFSKMYNSPTGNLGLHSWSINDVWYPSKLIMIACTHTTTNLTPWSGTWGGTGVNSGFLDCHAEFVPWSNMSNAYTNYSYGDGSKNLDWTGSGYLDSVGVHQKDVQ
jgi:prepilin-type N-terminal cleavage/methylation domain-containing protein